MKMRSLIGLFVAVAFTAGSGAVHAIKLVAMDEMHPGHDDAVSSYTYAKETLLKTSGNTTTSSDVGDNTTYYDITGDHRVAGPADIAGRGGDTYLVSYTMNNMVFATVVTDGASNVSDIAVRPAGETVADNLLSVESEVLQKIAGGAIGDSHVVFRLNSALETNLATSDVITLTADLAHSGSGSGSITRTVVNRALEGSGVSSSRTHTLPSAIKVLSALKEVIKPNEEGPVSSVDFDFMSFYRSTPANKKLADWVGYIHLKVADPPYLHAHATVDIDGEGDGTEMYPAMVTMLDQVIGADTTVTSSGTTRTNNSVTITGDVSFVTGIGFSDGEITGGISSDCVIGDDIRVPSTDDATMLTDEFMTLEAGDFDEVQFLCIAVDGETVIPETDAYTLTTKYGGIAGAAFPPQGRLHELGDVTQDGTRYTIPYLTTFAEYNQRLSLVNFGTKAVRYEFHSFNSEDGVTAMGGTAAEGELPVGQTVLKTSDIVDIMGGNRASVRLAIVSAPRHMSAAVQQVNLETRGVDTVYLVHNQ